MFTKLEKRMLLFLLGCIPARLLVVYAAKTMSISKLVFMAYLSLIPAIGFLVIYFFKLRKTGSETFGEPIWWNDLRPIHAAFYFLFAYTVLVSNVPKEAWKWLLLDVVFGLSAFIAHHFVFQ